MQQNFVSGLTACSFGIFLTASSALQTESVDYMKTVAHQYVFLLQLFRVLRVAIPPAVHQIDWTLAVVLTTSLLFLFFHSECVTLKQNGCFMDEGN